MFVESFFIFFVTRLKLLVDQRKLVFRWIEPRLLIFKACFCANLVFCSAFSLLILRLSLFFFLETVVMSQCLDLEAQ